jgi:putative radical SAM enzyme (TIGR03279 family)
MAHKIAKIIPNSIAHELELEAGDILLSINGEKICDVLDYRFAVAAEELLLEIQKPTEIWELEIEKDHDTDLGIIFENPLLSPTRHCTNNCVFCFVAQQPSGLRPSLYVKDDDPRLSFLHGNYVTLTNLSLEEIHRLASFHLSPMRISVHTTDLTLRSEIMQNQNATNLFTALKILSDANIHFHFQVVLCKNINTDTLSQTIETLSTQKNAQSLAIVPPGITRHREGLTPLTPFTPTEAKKIITQITAAQKKCRQTIGKTFVFAADEWYIMSNTPLPTYDEYEDFLQLDNGVGVIRLFEQEFVKTLGSAQTRPLFEKSGAKTLTFGIITGVAAAEFMRKTGESFMEAFPWINITVYAIRNDFFGENITVSGLLTGTDIIAQLRGKITADVLFLPENAFRKGTKTMLDNTTLPQLARQLSIPIKIGSTNGKKFLSQLIKQCQSFCPAFFKKRAGGGQSPRS